MHAAGDTVWVAVRVPRDDWQTAWEGRAIAPGGEMTRTAAPDASDLYRSMIEAVHAQRGEVIARTFVDGLVTHFLHDGDAAVYRTDAVGRPSLQIVSLRVD